MKTLFAEKREKKYFLLKMFSKSKNGKYPLKRSLRYDLKKNLNLVQ